MDRGSDAELADENGKTALMLAYQNCQFETVKCLIGTGSVITRLNSWGYTVLIKWILRIKTNFFDVNGLLKVSRRILFSSIFFQY